MPPLQCLDLHLYYKVEWWPNNACCSWTGYNFVGETARSREATTSPTDVMSSVKELARMYKQRAAEKVKKDTKPTPNTMLLYLDMCIFVCIKQVKSEYHHITGP